MSATESTGYEFHEFVRGDDGAVEGVKKPRQPRVDLELVGEFAAEARKAYAEGRVAGRAEIVAAANKAIEAAVLSAAAQMTQATAEALVPEVWMAGVEAGARLGWAEHKKRSAAQ